jgi:hypothetical protein
VHDIAGDLVSDVADEDGDRETRHRVAPRLAQRDRDQRWPCPACPAACSAAPSGWSPWPRCPTSDPRWTCSSS